MRLPVEKILPLAALTMLAACGGGSRPAATLQPNGPAGDYPMVLGPAYVIGGQTYTPADTMNYDSVGRAEVGAQGGAAVSAAHRTLPLPSYVEVTSLETGKTALVRIERRGPLAGDDLIELSPGAAQQLGLASGAQSPVRVRRVNPVEPDRAALRAGRAASPRMDTPGPLLAVLKRRLEQQEGGSATATSPTVPPVPAAAATPIPQAASKPESDKPPVKAAESATHGYFVQVGAYSNRANADAAARKAGGSVVRAGALWKVRTGPFGNDAAARSALAKAKGGGYSDARIQRAE